MATWSKVYDGLVGNLRQDQSDNQLNCLASDGINIYYGRNADPGEDRIYKYDTSSDTESAIADSDSFNGAKLEEFVAKAPLLAYFKSDLYALLKQGTDDLEVWRWSGSGKSWSKVFGTDEGGFPLHLYCTDSVMVVTGYNPTSASTFYDNTTWYTTDGTTWTQGSIDIRIGSFDGTFMYGPCVEQYLVGNVNSLTIYSQMIQTKTSVDFTEKLYQFNSGTGAWDVVREHEPSFDLDYYDRSVFWDQVSNSNFDYSEDLDTWLSPASEPAAHALEAVNIPVSIGSDTFTSDPPQIFFWDDDNNDWINGESIAGGDADPFHAVRLTDKTVYVMVNDREIAPKLHMYKRSAIYETAYDSLAQVQFYHSRGTPLVQKSNTPFAAVDIGNMAIKEDETTVYLATNTASDTQKVAKAVTDDDYATWANLTDDLGLDDVESLEKI